MTGKRPTNPLARGFYTVPEAARLIRAGGTRRIYGWLRGYQNRDVGPLLTRDYEPIGDAEELSFLDLMEVRFVEHFREHAKIRSLRIAAQKLRQEYGVDHPFAFKGVMVIADKADIYLAEVLRESAAEAGDVRLRSLVTDNYVMYEAIKRGLLPGVSFDPKSNLASEWAPLPDRFPRISIDPRKAYGQPIIPIGVPTGVLYDAWRAENENADAVAYWYGITVAEVAEAVRFEEALDDPVQRRAA